MQDCYAGVTLGLLVHMQHHDSTALVLRLLEIGFWHLKWCPRRHKWTFLRLMNLVAHLLNTLLFLAPNVLYLAQEDEGLQVRTVLMFFMARFTIWNTLFFSFMLEARVLSPWVDRDFRPIAGEDAILLDAPWTKHYVFGLLWLFCEGCILAATILAGVAPQLSNELGGKFSHLCINPKLLYTVVSTIAILFLVYLVSSLFLAWSGHQQLNKKSYQRFRWINVKLRYHQRQVVFVGTFVFLSVVLISLGRESSCFSTLTVLLGLAPAQLAMTFLAVVNGYLMTPVYVNDQPLLMHPKVSWVDGDSRAGNLVKCGKQHNFSFESALKLWYWSLLPYRIQNVGDEITVDVAKKLYHLKHHEVVVVEASDVVAVISWSSQTLLISFRGTSSRENIRSDMNAWRVNHPPTRGHLLKCTRPLVHEGFLCAWHKSNFSKIILNRVIQIVNGDGFHKDSARVILTGHSMGGALAVLASMDIARYCGVASDNIVCYTFGGPRVGNHAFRSEYNATVPNTWQVVNDNDLVPSIPSFGPFFAHVGTRVIIDYAGNMIVHPLFVENSLKRDFFYFKGSRSMTQHLMRNYRRSLAAIAQAQFIKRKGSLTGMDSLRELFMTGELRELEDTLGVSSNHLNELHRKGTTVWRDKSSGSWGDRSWFRSKKQIETRDSVIQEDEENISALVEELSKKIDQST